MVRIAGVNIPLDKRLEVALTSIFGIGQTTSKKILAATAISPNLRGSALETDDLTKLRNLIDADYRTEGSLRQYYAIRIKRLIAKRCLRGKRHRMRLPVRGQRTRTNARTRKGILLFSVKMNKLSSKEKPNEWSIIVVNFFFHEKKRFNFSR